MGQRIHHIGITVVDVERAARFYTEGLGCDVVVRQTSAAAYLGMTGYPGVEIAAVLVRLPEDNVHIELQEYRHVAPGPPRPPGTAPAGSSHVCLAVDDLAATLDRAERFGGRRVTDPVEIDSGINTGARGVYLRDPDGYTLELFQRPR